MSLSDKYSNITNFNNLWTSNIPNQTAKSTPAVILPEEEKLYERPLTNEEILSLGKGPIAESQVTSEEKADILKTGTITTAKNTSLYGQMAEGAKKGISLGYWPTEAPAIETTPAKIARGIGEFGGSLVPLVLGSIAVASGTALPFAAGLALKYPALSRVLQTSALFGLTGLVEKPKTEEGVEETRTSNAIVGAIGGTILGGLAETVPPAAKKVFSSAIKIPAVKTAVENIGKELGTYKQEILKGAEDLALPVMEKVARKFPNTFSYNNSYTKFMTRLLDDFKNMLQNVDVANINLKSPSLTRGAQHAVETIKPMMGGLGSKAAETMLGLLREKNRIYNALSKRFDEDIVQKLEKYSYEERKQIGDMINKYIPVEPQYKEIVKDVDTAIAALGKDMVSTYQNWYKTGGITYDEMKLKADTWLGNVGQYARSFYLKPKEELQRFANVVPKYIPSNIINLSPTKHKMSLTDWADRRLFGMGQVLDTSLRLLNLNNYEEIVLKGGGYNTIKDIAKASAKDILELFPQRAKTLKAEIDAVMRPKIEEVITDLGATKETLASMAQNVLGRFSQTLAGADKRIVTRFGSTERTLSHELGHLIDSTHNLVDLLGAKTSQELRAVADLRLPSAASDYFKSYVRRSEEKVAEFVSLYLKDRNKLAEIAPESFKKFEEFIAKTPPLNKLMAIEPTMIQGLEKTVIDVKGFAKNLINNAKKVLKDYEIISLSQQEIDVLGLAAKKASKYVYDALPMVVKTFQDLIGNKVNMGWLDTIYQDLTLFSKTLKEGFTKVIDLLPSKASDARLGPLNSGYINNALIDEIKFVLKTGKSSTDMAWETLVRWWKWSKVAVNLPTVVRNWMSGHFFQTDLAGYPVWNPDNFKAYMKDVVDYFQKGPIYIKARNAGQYGANYFKVEISPELEKELLGSTDIVSFWSKFNKNFSKFVNNTGQYYGMIDDVARTYLFERAIADGFTEAEAVTFANTWQLDYRVVPDAINKLRGMAGGAIFPFLSYYYLMLPRIMEVAFTRPWVLLKYPLLTTAFSYFMSKQMGMSMDALEARKPDYLVGKPYVIPVGFDDSQDNPQPEFWDLGYNLPIGDLSTGFIDVNGFIDMTKTMGLFGLARDLVVGESSYTGKQFREDIDWSLATDKEKRQAILDSLGYFGKFMTPTMFTHLWNLKEALQGKTVGYGAYETKKNTAEALLRLLGISVSTGGDWAFRSKLNNIDQELKDKYIKRVRIMSNSNLSDKEKEKELQDVNDAIENIQNARMKLMIQYENIEGVKTTNDEGWEIPSKVNNLDNSSSPQPATNNNGWTTDDEGWLLPPGWKSP